MSAICERCGAAVSGPMCDLCGGTRFVAGPSAPPPPEAAPTPPPVVGDAEHRADSQPGGAQPNSGAPAAATRAAITASTPQPGRNKLIAGGPGAAVVVPVIAVVMQLGGRNSAPAAAVPLQPEPTNSASPTPESSPTDFESTSAASYACWDGGTTESLDSCGVPEGVAGLKCALPGLAANLSGSTYSCSYVKYPKRTEFTLSYDCPASGNTLKDAGRLVRYRYWEDGAVARKHYRKVFSDGGSRPFILDGQNVGTVYWNSSPKEYGCRVRAFTLFDSRIVLSVERSSPRLLDQTLQEARFRAAEEQLYGYSGATPSEGTWKR